ncbi:MFS transporter [Prevotella sp. A2931]|uniref:MFS transporter n=1 Tax=Prevotella illustrans TaxID=2800387 RepID=A0ABS3M502_9BACT|nr:MULTISPECIES: MFS transporter [Prevotella]MBO1363253.1 MFS transporter [Prevotella illustrans]PTL26603.1 MFS transporter [Prevotella sp. oral taxon 820]
MEKMDVYSSLGEQRKKFLSWQTRTILVTMLGYATFYFVRKNFSLAMPGLTAEYGITNKSFGWIIFASSLVYGFSRFINGYTVDRIKGRIVMALGLLLCAAANFAFGFGVNLSQVFTGTTSGPDFTSALILVMGVTIILNQYFQGMGFPPCARILPHWIHPAELATKMSIWNTSHSIGAACAVIVCGYIMGSMGSDMSANTEVVARVTANLTNNDVANAATQALTYAAHIGAWKWCFWIPACMAVAGAIFIFLGLRDEPKEVGLPDLPDTSLGNYSESMSGKARKRFESVMVWRNRWVWTFCIANMFVYVVRMGVLDWGPKFLTESRGMDISTAGWTVAAFEIAGIVGTLFAGWATDHIFQGKGHRMCVMCMLGAAAFMTVFRFLPQSAGITVTAAVLVGAGFCIYGPQALVGIELSKQATKEASARANGIAGILGYIGSGCSGLLVGYVADLYGWTRVFETIIVVAVVGMFILLSMWRAPRDGYARSQQINYDEE